MLPCDIACRWTQTNNEKTKEVLVFKSSPRQQMQVEHKTPEGREELVWIIRKNELRTKPWTLFHLINYRYWLEAEGLWSKQSCEACGLACLVQLGGCPGCLGGKWSQQPNLLGSPWDMWTLPYFRRKCVSQPSGNKINKVLSWSCCIVFFAIFYPVLWGAVPNRVVS